MKNLLFLIVFLSANLSLASGQLLKTPFQESWGFGVGWGTESSYDSVTVFEVRTPSLFTFNHGLSRVNLVLSYENKEVSQTNKNTTPLHLLFELTSAPYKDLVRSYLRLGGGTVLVDDDTLFHDSNFFNVQAQLGVDLVTGVVENGMSSSFFVQAMLNSAAIRDPALDGFPNIYDGISVVGGLRAYF